MSELLLVTGVLEPSSEVLPALGLLLHSVRVLPADASALDIEKAALADPKVQAALEGRTPKKVIVVPNKLVSFVL